MKEEDTGYTIRIYTTKGTSLSLGHFNDAVQQKQIDAEKGKTACKSESLSQGSEDKISMLLGNILAPCLGALQKSFSY